VFQQHRAILRALLHTAPMNVWPKKLYFFLGTPKMLRKIIYFKTSTKYDFYFFRQEKFGLRDPSERVTFQGRIQKSAVTSQSQRSYRRRRISSSKQQRLKSNRTQESLNGF
jgi:hypothetical protein